jgi:AAA domain/DnaB-like helicase N terminal domain
MTLYQMVVPMISPSAANNGSYRANYTAADHAAEDHVEAVILATMIRYGSDSIDKVRKVFSPFDFRAYHHQLIVRAILTAYDRGEPIDIHAVAGEIAARGHGGDVRAEYLIDLVENSSASLDRYIQAMRRHCTIRLVRRAGSRLEEIAAQPDLSPEQMIEAAKAELLTALPVSTALPIVTAGALIDTHQHLREPIIDGLLRVGETMNLISAPKVGKSWLSVDLAFSAATGRKWLDMFPTSAGNVLLIDNELHAETIAARLRRMAEARGIDLALIREKIHVVSLRGRLQDLSGLGRALMAQAPGIYRLVILDALYRAMPMQTDENDNGTMAQLYNQIDAIADHLQAGIALVHHSTKGNQSEKSVTDVGAGAGAQSRATDTHLVLRPHEEDGVFVLDAAVRSWAPVAPCCLRWNWPVWTPAPELDPTKLRLPRSRRSRRAGATEPEKPPDPTWNAKRFADAFGKTHPQNREVVLESARQAGLSERKATTLLKGAIGCGYLYEWRENDNSMVATEKPPETPKKTGKSAKRRHK